MAEGFLVISTLGYRPLYLLFLLLSVFSLNKLDRFSIAVLSQPMARDIKFGDKGCLPFNATFSRDYKTFCVNGLKESSEPENNKET